MKASAQLSIYPLRQESLVPAISAVRKALESRGLQPEVGPMSTSVTGDSAAIFPALQEAFEAAAKTGDTVLTITVSNACPT